MVPVDSITAPFQKRNGSRNVGCNRKFGNWKTWWCCGPICKPRSCLKFKFIWKSSSWWYPVLAIFSLFLSLFCSLSSPLSGMYTPHEENDSFALVHWRRGLCLLALCKPFSLASRSLCKQLNYHSSPSAQREVVNKAQQTGEPRKAARRQVAPRGLQQEYKWLFIFFSKEGF